MAGDKTSDNSLYYRIGRFKFEWNPNKKKQERILKKYKKDGCLPPVIHTLNH